MRVRAVLFRKRVYLEASHEVLDESFLHGQFLPILLFIVNFFHLGRFLADFLDAASLDQHGVRRVMSEVNAGFQLVFLQESQLSSPNEFSEEGRDRDTSSFS